MKDLQNDNLQRRSKLKLAQCWVIKIGSSLLTNNGLELDEQAIGRWVDQIAWLRTQGVQVVLVSSGAVAAGMSRLGMTTRPTSIHELQAAAAVGQMGLIQTYETAFQRHGLRTAQVLLTHDDLSDRNRYLNARSALLCLLNLGVVPVVNENDTVATDEIRFGDNDTLGALVANLVAAEVLTILTDQSGMFQTDPRENPNARLVAIAKANDSGLVSMATPGGGGLGRGGMVTKLRSAQLASRSGAATIIAGGREPDILKRLFAGEDLGTLLLPEQDALTARKQWLAAHLQMKGTLTLDQGAIKVLKSSGSSLLAVGVIATEGEYERGDMLACLDEQGNRIACGLVNYSAAEVQLIKRRTSKEFDSILGYMDQDELIHRDNMVVF